jgi:hypothetical protein
MNYEPPSAWTVSNMLIDAEAAHVYLEELKRVQASN